MLVEEVESVEIGHPACAFADLAETINDPSAEPTGFIFDGTGKVAFYNVQHGQQPAALLDITSNPIDGTTDDLIKITGWKKVRKNDDD